MTGAQIDHLINQITTFNYILKDHSKSPYIIESIKVQLGEIELKLKSILSAAKSEVRSSIDPDLAIFNGCPCPLTCKKRTTCKDADDCNTTF